MISDRQVVVDESARRILGRSDSTRRLRAEVARVAPFDCSVLIIGPSGTGKELVARELHRQSPRCDGRFIPVDCASLTSELMASQLFGHLAGAFTGASYSSLGCFRAADGGTIFFDEIGELLPTLQAKLLRVVQERAVVPVGSHDATAIDVRIVAATNRDLKRDVIDGRFREDLFFRLNVVTIHTEPLSVRPDDIVPLAEHFLRDMEAHGQPHKVLSHGSLKVLESFSWPGNVRQLRNVLEQSAIESDGPLVGMPLVEHLLDDAELINEDQHPATQDASSRLAAVSSCRSGESESDLAGLPTDDDWPTISRLERAHVLTTLEHTYYNQSAAARLLGITRQALVRKMEKYGIRLPNLKGRRHLSR